MRKAQASLILVY